MDKYKPIKYLLNIQKKKNSIIKLIKHICFAIVMKTYTLLRYLKKKKKFEGKNCYLLH